MKPLVSVIIPVYNEEKRIKECLDSIYSQFFKEIEVLIIDDDSTDRTLEIAKKYPVKIFRNGKKDYDVGKAIGINKAKGKFLFFIDADNRLKDKKFLSKAVEILERKKEVIGVQAWKFFYSSKHNIATRYQDLFGNADPVVFYLKSQDHLQFYEKEWKLKGKIIEDKKEHLIIRFEKKEIPTLGSQGFLTRKKYFENIEKFQHIEHFINILEKEKNGVFCFLKSEVEHLGFNSTKDIIKKLARNFEHYLKDRAEKRQERYSLNLFKIIFCFLKMESLVLPIYDALKGYFHKKDSAWFLHIFLSFIIPCIYAWKFVSFKVKSTSFQV